MGLLTHPHGPTLLFGLGAAMAAWLARRRSRHQLRKLDRLLVAAYLTLAVLCVAQAAWLTFDRGGRFVAVSWNAAEQTLRLDRAFPLRDVTLTRREIASITEIALPEHGLTGTRASVEFEIRTESGTSFWSTALHREQDRRHWLARLAPATGGRIARFIIGKQSLP